MRIFYHAINGSGLGHLTRLSSIALAVRQEAPDVHQMVASSANYPPLLRRLGMPCIILPRDDGAPYFGADRRTNTVSARLASQILCDMVGTYDPNLVVFDTHAPRAVLDEVASSGRHSVLVLRHCRDEVLLKQLREGLLARFSLVLLPHTPTELRKMLPAGTVRQLENLATVRYVGGIVFPVDLEARAIERTATRYGIAAGESFLLICAGSGGYNTIHQSFLTKACRTALAARRSNPGLRILCVAGPYAERLALPEDCQVIDAEPELQLLMTRAAVVVAHAGYNTVQEVLRTGTRALFIPVHRRSEDQSAFVRAHLPRAGWRMVMPDEPELLFENAIGELLRGPKPSPVIADGAVAAARLILALCDLPEFFICSRTVLSTPAPGKQLGARSLARTLADKSSSLARLCVDWDILASVVGPLDAAARARLIGIEVNVGPASADVWLERINHVCGVLHETGIDLTKLTVCLDDSSGGLDMATLTERLGKLSFHALVAHVPEQVFRSRLAQTVAATERCRSLNPGFRVDITILDKPIAYVDQP